MSGRPQRDAADIRSEWLGHALSTRPADRPAAEAAISGLYELLGLAPPRFHWASSPAVALETVPPGLRLRSDAHRASSVLQGRLNSLHNALRRDLSQQTGIELPWLDRMVRVPLSRSWNACVAPLLAGAHGYGRWRSSRYLYLQSSLEHVGYFDMLRRVMGAVYDPELTRRFELWAAVVRSCGLWWPYEGVCVVSERPAALHVERGSDDEAWLHCPDGPAVRYSDGWELYAWHGTPVPSWVVNDPSADRIAAEPNIEVRRCAIENLGWPEYIEQAGLRLLASAPDPGNPGFELHLYQRSESSRVLLAVNGSVERDGHRRRYGLTVPVWCPDPVTAAGWTYGLTAEQYTLLARRT